MHIIINNKLSCPLKFLHYLISSSAFTSLICACPQTTSLYTKWMVTPGYDTMILLKDKLSVLDTRLNAYGLCKALWYAGMRELEAKENWKIQESDWGSNSGPSDIYSQTLLPSELPDSLIAEECRIVLIPS